MKKIGREVAFLPTDKENSRNGEGSFLRLKDGRILFCFTRYGSVEDDHGTAELAAIYSDDEGETWSAPTLLVRKDEGAQNIMSASLLRMQNGDMGIVYLRKSVVEGTKIVCEAVFSRSRDEGKTWSPYVKCLPDGYYCGINDGVTVTRAGRIIVPASYHGAWYDYATGKTAGDVKSSTVRFAYSDDDGATWQRMEGEIASPLADSIGFAEPGIYEHEDGTLWAYMRTAYGYQYQAHSTDGGKTFSSPVPNFYFSSPDSPMRIRRLGKYTVAVFNPLGYNCLRGEAAEAWKSPKRTPLVCYVTEDDGAFVSAEGRTQAHGTFFDAAKHTYLLEDDPENSFCYPAVTQVKDGFLVAYYHSNGSEWCLNATKIVKVGFNEIL